MSTQAPAELVILSGGSEIVGLALAAAAQHAGIPYAVMALGPRSVLRDAPGCVALIELASLFGDWPALRDGFLRALARLARPAGGPLVILPTEDGSLRLLNECRDHVLEYGEFPRARGLRMGGVDKAEVAEMAALTGVEDCMAPSRILTQVGDAVAAFECFDGDAIFKPALKPIDMDLAGMGALGEKVVARRTPDESEESVMRRLQCAWPLSERWIAQPRLRVGAGVERSVCAVRASPGVVQAGQVVEQGKYPRMGGTAYWVATEPGRDLVPGATRLLEALDVVGVCELSYLPDAAGVSRMIELNPRPWLQIGLLERAGFPVVVATVAALQGRTAAASPVSIAPQEWIQMERALLAAGSGGMGLRQLGRFLASVGRAETSIAGYGSGLPGVRRKLLMKMLRRLLG